MSSFVRYILKFKHDQNAYGDLARDILMDPKVKRNWGYRSFVKHLGDMNASQRIFEIVECINFEYKIIKDLRISF